MNRIDRYLFKSVVSGVLLVTFAFAAVFGGLNFVYELHAVSRGQYGLLVAGEAALLKLPGSIYQLFPVIVLVGSMLGLGGLASGSELVAMRASGVSLQRMAWAVLKAGILFAIFSLALSEYIAPRCEALAEKVKVTLQSSEEAALVNNGFWLRDGDSFIRADTVLTTHVLMGVEVFRFSEDRKLQLALKAADARFINGQWQLDDVKLTEIHDETTEVRERPVMRWNTNISPRVLSGSVLPPEEQTLQSLYRTMQYLSRFGLDDEMQRLAFWRKLASPILALVMTVVAIPFVLGALRSTDAGQRMFLGVVIGAVCFFLNETSGYASQVYRFDPLLSAWLPTGMVAVFAIVGLWYRNSPGRFHRLLRSVNN